MKHLKKFNESDTKEYLKSEEFYKDLTDKLFFEINDYFKEKRFFPLNVKLDRRGSNVYYGSVCMAGGWSNRMNDKEEDWLFAKLKHYKNEFGIDYSACADSFASSVIYNIENDNWPKESIDYLNFPPDPFPDRDS
jgi:hypothetical protein